MVDVLCISSRRCVVLIVRWLLMLQCVGVDLY